MKDDSIHLDTLAARLRQTEPAITDGDFARAVLAQLPPRRVWRERLHDGLFLGATALGSAIVAWQMPLPAVTSVLDMVSANPQVAVLTGVALTYATAGAALWTTDGY